MRLALAFLTLSPLLPAQPADTLVFSFFRNNGEDGLYLATSKDGLTWTPLNGDKPLLKPEAGEQKLMRDPSIARAPDGTFHMVWTTSWQGRTLGYASSKDLITWSAQKTLTPFGKGEEVLNCWAPEIYFDTRSREFVVVWASTIKGRFAETLAHGHRDYNHRLYYFRTRDFVKISEPQLLFEPGFQTIDGAIFRVKGKYAMVAKNENLKPEAKYLFLTFANAISGPWTNPSESISGKEWAEGPAPIQIGDYWYIYFDKYRAKKYGVIRSKDLRSWEDLTDPLRMPDGVRHGTAFRAPAAIVRKLSEPRTK